MKGLRQASENRGSDAVFGGERSWKFPSCSGLGSSESARDKSESMKIRIAAQEMKRPDPRLRLVVSLEPKQDSVPRKISWWQYLSFNVVKPLDSPNFMSKVWDRVPRKWKMMKAQLILIILLLNLYAKTSGAQSLDTIDFRM